MLISSHASLPQAALLLASALCTDIEDLRRKLIDCELLPFVIAGLSSPFPAVRCAAAQCTRSLSRSINIIKTALLDTNAAPAFVDLLAPAEDTLTQLAILAVICNVFIEYSPLKTCLLEMEGLVERIVSLTRISTSPPAGSQSHSAARKGSIDKLETSANQDRPAGDGMQEVLTMLRHHALTALKNMTYWSSSSLKQKTAKCLTWEYAVA